MEAGRGRVIPERGGDIFCIIFINSYSLYVPGSIMHKRQVDEDKENLHSYTKCVCGGGVMKEGGGLRKVGIIEYVISLGG